MNDLTESIVQDLIKNSLTGLPIDCNKDEVSKPAKPEIDHGKRFEEEDSLQTKPIEDIPKEEARLIKSPMKKKQSRFEEQSKEEEPARAGSEEEEMELSYQDIDNVLYTDTKVMNFGSYLPGGKLLGSNLTVQNITNCEQIIELSVDSSSFRYKIDDLY